MDKVERAREIRKQMEENATPMSDYMALQFTELFPKWNGESVSYKVGDRVRFSGTLYKVLTDHISQGDWTPANAVSLFAKVLIPDPTEVPAWEQPNSTNPYMKGDKVTHNNTTWESIVDNNVWEPGTTGTESLWKAV